MVVPTTSKNTDYFVDTPERESIAGPHAGRTYRDVYGFNPDFTRLSARNRDVITSKANLTYRFNRKIGSVRLIWDYDSVDREYYEVAPGTTKTTSNELGVTWSAQARAGLEDQLPAEGRQRHRSVQRGQLRSIRPWCRYRPPSPLAPTSAQYYEFHDARIAEGTAVPESWTRFEARGTYTGNSSSVTANYRYWDGKNTSGDLTDWSRLNQAASVTLWSVAGPQMAVVRGLHLERLSAWIQWPTYHCTRGERAVSQGRASLARIVPLSTTT